MEALTSYTMRDFLNQPEQIDFIIKSLALDPKLNKHSLSLLLCKKYSFISPSGEIKLSSCQAVVSDLVKNKKITLEPLLKHKGKFNSMVLSSVNHPLPNNLPANVQEIKNEIEIILIARDGDDDKKQIWNDIIGKEHYLGVTRPVGYIVKYLIKFEGCYIAAACFSSSAFNLEARDKWLGWSEDQKKQYRNQVISMSRFLIRKDVQCANLASHLLSKLISSVKVDFENRYKIMPFLIESFIDTESHTGTCYKASNWKFLGQSKGRGRNDSGHKNIESIKDLYVYVLEPSFRKTYGFKPEAEEYPPMKIETIILSSEWAKHEFGGIDLGDSRLTDRVVRIAKDKSEFPTSSYAKAVGGVTTDINAYYKFLRNGNKEITVEAIFSQHQKNTICRMANYQQVIVAHDSSSLNFSSLKNTKGLGRIGKNDKSESGTLGLQTHTALAMTIDGIPLGVLSSPCTAPKINAVKNPATIRPISEKETFRWLVGYNKIVEISKKIKNTQIISVMDREGDIFEIFEVAIDNCKNAPIVVRIRHNRILKDSDLKLYETMDKEENKFNREIRVPPQRAREKSDKKEARPYMPARDAILVISYVKVTIMPPDDKILRHHAPIPLYAIYARELDPPAGAEKIEWRLATTFELKSKEDAFSCLDYYGNRWGIEELYRIVKSGCKIEDTKLNHANKIERITAISLVIAWRIFLLTFLGRQNPNISAEKVFTDDELITMNLISKKKRN